jgi:hypothetical protein
MWKWRGVLHGCYCDMEMAEGFAVCAGRNVEMAEGFGALTQRRKDAEAQGRELET